MLEKLKIKLQKPTKKQVMQSVIYIAIVLFGNALAAAASALFIIPNGYVMGGTTGLGIFMRNLLRSDYEYIVSITIYAVNIVLFLIGALMLGKKFAVATLAGTLLYPTFITFFTFINDLYVTAHGVPIAHGDPWLSIVFGSLLFGFGIGIVVRVGASTGGTDIPPLILKKYFGIPVAVTLWALDFLIVLLQLVAVDLETVLYGVVITIFSSIIVDIVSPIGTRKRQVQIISKKWAEIREMILHELQRGVTLMYARTGYLQEDRYVLMTIVSSREVVRLRNAVQAIDPEAFLTVSVVSEVRGRGFSSDKIALMPEQEATPIVPGEKRPTGGEVREEPVAPPMPTLPPEQLPTERPVEPGSDK